MINSMRSEGSSDGPKPLALSDSAREAIRERVAAEEDPVAFFAMTRPSRLGFDVGVGFRRLDTEAGESTHPAFDAPVLVTDEDYARLAGITIDFRDGHFVTFSDVSIHVSETPNPDSRKFIVNRDVIDEGSLTFVRPLEEDAPPLVQLLFGIPEVKSIFLMKNFVSVTQKNGAEWGDLQMEVGKRIQGYFAHGGATLAAPEDPQARYTGVEKRIVEVLEDVVRPAVQRDGGDIAFAGFEDGTVQLYMLGSCVGCPSSLATLKMGVENLLKDTVPEVKEVVAIQ